MTTVTHENVLVKTPNGWRFKSCTVHDDPAFRLVLN